MGDKEVNELQRKIYAEIEKKEQAVTRDISVVEHAKIVRAELKKKYPTHKFQVRVDHFSGGNAVRVYHIGEIDWDLDKEFSEFIHQFDGYAGDLMDGMYNVGFMYNDERIRGADFCIYHHWIKEKKKKN